MKKLSAYDMNLCAMFAALSAVMSQIMLPIGPVPVTLTHISIYMAAGLLGAKKAAISQIIFVLLGAAGVPVFSGLRGGVSVLLGPTGGFIIGYIVCAYVVGLIVERFGIKMKVLVPAMLVGIVVTYLPGLLWYMFLSNAGLYSALAICVLPFLPGDFLKIVLCSILVRAISPVVQGLINSRRPLE